MSSTGDKINTALNLLKESRRRFIVSAIVVLIAFIISLFFTNRIIQFFESLSPPGTKFVTYQLAGNFETYVQVCLFSALALASPFLVYQAIRSFAPILPRKQKMYVFTFVPLIALFFIAGALYATYLHLPLILQFVVGFPNEIGTGITPMLNIGQYVGFLTKVYFIIGLVFEFPVIAFILAKFGLITHQWIASKWRWGLLGSAVIAALVTPTGDVFHDGLKNLLLVDCGFSASGPIFILYFLSIFMAWLGRKPKEAIEVAD